MNVPAISALTQVDPFTSAASPSATQPSGGAGATFESALSQMLTNATDPLKQGEAAAIQGIQGSMSAYKVVDAVLGAQRSLQAALAVRDKAVAAFQELSRMNI
jgi:flagellar hook-basal body complex protein FliE